MHRRAHTQLLDDACIEVADLNILKAAVDRWLPSAATDRGVEAQLLIDAGKQRSPAAARSGDHDHRLYLILIFALAKLYDRNNRPDGPARRRLGVCSLAAIIA
jgi:hypothetical protein